MNKATIEGNWMQFKGQVKEQWGKLTYDDLDVIAGDYKVAKDKCGSLKAKAKDICMSEAKGVEKIAKVATDTSKSKTDKMADVKKDAATEESKALYKAANERCDALAGAPKDACVSDAKVKFGMK